MNNLRKQMHVKYKETIFNMIIQFIIESNNNSALFRAAPEMFIKNWIDRNCLPIGDFSKEDVIKEMEAWQNADV